MKLYFSNPFDNQKVSIISYKNMPVGEIYFDSNFNIIDTNVSGYFFHELKNDLLRALLKKYGINKMHLICDKKYQEYYEEFGFEVDKMLEKNNIRMKFEFNLNKY